MTYKYFDLSHRFVMVVVFQITTIPSINRLVWLVTAVTIKSSGMPHKFEVTLVFNRAATRFS